MFELDPHVKRECIWHGPVYKKASALVDRRNNFVWLATTRDEEPVMLTRHLADTDSMLASVADPQRAPEMLAVREAVRGWRFYDHFRTDADSPARAAQIGTFTPVLQHDGSDLAAALQTILEIRSDEALTHNSSRRFSRQHGFLWKCRTDASNCICEQHGLLRLSFRSRVVGWNVALSLMGCCPAHASTAATDGGERTGNQPASRPVTGACQLTCRSETHADHCGFACTVADPGTDECVS